MKLSLKLIELKKIVLRLLKNVKNLLTPGAWRVVLVSPNSISFSSIKPIWKLLAIWSCAFKIESEVLLNLEIPMSFHLKCSFKSIFEKKHKIFPLQSPFLVCRTWCVYWSTPYSKKPILSQKIPACEPVTPMLTLHYNFYPNIWVFSTLPIYRKLIHDNISLELWKPKIFCLVLFWTKYKTVCTYKYLH